MPQQQGTGFVFGQVALSIVGLRRREEQLQDLEQHCHDPLERARIRAEWNQVERAEDGLLQHIIQQGNELDGQRDGWALRTLKGEPTCGQLREAPAKRETPTVSAVSA